MNRSTREISFEIVSGMQPRGILDSRDVVDEGKRSVEGEDSSSFMKSLHEKVKLEQSN